MNKADKLLARWSRQVPSGGAKDSDALLVMEHLGLQVRLDGRNHYRAYHPKLVDSAYFPLGTFGANCHYLGKQGVAHPAAIRDVVRAARILRDEE